MRAILEWCCGFYQIMYLFSLAMPAGSDLFWTPMKLCYNFKCKAFCLSSASLTLSVDFYYGHGNSRQR
jgi:hypothetical protein